MSNLIRLADVPRREVVWLDAQHTMPRGMLHILAGHPGLGKSMLTCKMMADLSLRGLASVICSAEDSLEYAIKPRLQALQADVSLIHALVPLDKDGNVRGVTFPTDADMLLEAILEVDAVFAAIDPITAVLDAKVDSHKDASLRSALAPLARVAEETDAAIQAVWHLNKSNGTDPMMRLGGSIGGPGAARSCLLLDWDPDDPNEEHGTRRVLAHFKCNVGPTQPSRQMRVEPILLPATNLEPEVSTARIVDEGASPHRAEALLAAGIEDGAGSDAAEFLVAELSDGPVAADAMLKRANKAGISERTLRRAKRLLRVESKRVGFGKDAVWTWSLKAATPPAPDLWPSMAVNDDEVAANGAKAAKAAIDGQGNETSPGGHL